MIFPVESDADYYHQLEHERIHLLLIDEASKGLDDVAAGCFQDARSTPCSPLKAAGRQVAEMALAMPTTQGLVAVKLTANFERNLADIETFLTGAQAPQAYDDLLDNLLLSSFHQRGLTRAKFIKPAEAPSWGAIPRQSRCWAL